MILRHLAAYELAAEHLAGARRIVEIGSGEGYGGRLLADRGLDLTGLEVDLATTLRAGRAYSRPRCRFLCFAGGDLPLATAAFDGGLSLQVIEHVESDGRLAGEMARVLAPGSPALFTTPNAALRLRPGERPWNVYHRREYRADELTTVLSPYFRSVEVLGLRGSPPVQRLELERLRRIRTLGRLGSRRLRALLPTRIEARLRGLVRRLAAAGRLVADGDDVGRAFSTADFVLTDDPGEALDLVALCRR